MTKLRVNWGSDDYQVDMTVDQFESELRSGGGWMILPVLLGGSPHSTLNVRKDQIRYYYEEL